MQRLLDRAARSGGLEGLSVLSTGRDYFVLLRFATRAHLDAFTGAAETIALFKAVASLAVGTDRLQRRLALSGWFASSGLPFSPPPPAWKTAVILWAALLPQVLLLDELLPASIPHPLDVALTTAIAIALLVWVIMPWLTRLLRPWLH
ncbi:MAG TPA: antibiotic biosynthesis monooxygenase [Planctomycetota bacterium]